MDKTWQQLSDARVVMPLTLAIALVFAVVHDRFYGGLDGRNVGTVDQHLSIYVGTAFAFIVKAALGVAVTTTYAQQLWHTFSAHPLDLATIDSLSAFTGSALQLLDLKIAARFPLLTFVAIISYAISVFTVFPPGTLSVHTVYWPSVRDSERPLVDWLTSNIANTNISQLYSAEDKDGDGHSRLAASPLTKAYTLTSYAAALGQMPPISDIIVNSSYQLSFSGPGLTCSTHNWETQSTTQCQNICNYGNCSDGTLLKFPALDYVSWGSWSQYMKREKRGSWFGLPDNVVPIVAYDQGNDSALIDCDNIQTLSSLKYAWFGDDDPMIYVAAATAYPVHGNHTIWQVTSCRLSNASYTARYNFSDNVQNIDISMHNVTPLTDISKQWANLTHEVNGTKETNDRFIYAQFLGFYSMLLVLGRLSIGSFGHVLGTGPVAPIMSTRLAYTSELRLLSDDVANDGGLFDASSDSQQGLAATLEELCQNLTVTLMTSPLIAGLQNTSVTTMLPFPVYRYNQQQLWLSYGLGIGVTALIVAIGIARASKAGSYSMKPSTYLRTAQWDDCTGFKDSGKDPLPKQAAIATITLGSALSVAKDARKGGLWDTPGLITTVRLVTG